MSILPDKFPYRYSEFIDKVNAEWDGDPNGDYIMAEHINTLQDAIKAIEEYLGIADTKDLNITDSIKNIKLNSQVKLASCLWVDNISQPELNLNNINQYQNLIFNTINNQLKTNLIKINGNIYGAVDTQLALSTFQTKVNEWKSLDIKGILLLNFGLLTKRSIQNTYLTSVYDNNLEAIIDTNNPQQLINDEIVVDYNPNGISLSFNNQTTVMLRNFGYDSSYTPLSNIYGELFPLVQKFKDKNIKLIGQSMASSQSVYSYLNVLAMLLSVESLYIGEIGGNNNPVIYDWQSLPLQWKTNNLILKYDTSSLSRTMLGGRITLLANGKYNLQGDITNSLNIKYVNSSIPGSAIVPDTITSDKIKDYNIQKIIDSLNKSSDSIKINLDKINMTGDITLPASIPAENMMANVILAINKAVDINSTNNTTIPDAVIGQIDASKIVGTLRLELIEDAIIPAINKTANETDNYINVPRIDVGNINLSGTLSGPEAQIQAQIITGDTINSEVMLNAYDINFTNFMRGYDGEMFHLKVENLEATNIGGIKNLDVEQLNGKLINTIVLDAISANIQYGTFNQIVTEGLKAEQIQADVVNALQVFADSVITKSSMIKEGVILDAHIKDLTAGKLTAGTINTALVNLSSEEGNLSIEDKNIKIYDEIINNTRKLRVMLGNLSDSGIKTIDDLNLGYGLLVLGEDGTTRLYDNTGVYSEGIHDNAIVNTKIGDEAINSRVIAAGAIQTKHLTAYSIVSDKIAADAIQGIHISADSITGNKIKASSIDTIHLKVGSVDATVIESSAIHARHLSAGSIKTEHLSVGFGNNLMRQGFDSFEQSEANVYMEDETEARIFVPTSTQWSRDGAKSIKLSGPKSSNTFVFKNVGYFIPVQADTSYIVSSYFKTFAPTEFTIQIGLRFNDTEKTIIMGEMETIFDKVRKNRIQTTIVAPEGASGAAVVIRVNVSNTEVYFDAMQVEEVDADKIAMLEYVRQLEIERKLALEEEGIVVDYEVPPVVIEAGPYRPTATTEISGDSITTGRIDAKRIHLGTGTTFGDGKQVLITDAGIETISNTGKAILNSAGLTILNGAIKISNESTTKRFYLSGQTGIEVENGLSKIVIDVDKGIQIINKRTGEKSISIDANGNLIIAGSSMFYGKDEIPKNFTDSVAGLIEKQRNTLNVLVAFSQASNVINFYGYSTNPDYQKIPDSTQDGKIIDEIKQTTVVVPKQTLDLSSLPIGTKGYLAFDTIQKLMVFFTYKVIYEDIVRDNVIVQKIRSDEGWQLFNPNHTKHNLFVPIEENFYVLGEVER